MIEWEIDEKNCPNQLGITFLVNNVPIAEREIADLRSRKPVSVQLDNTRQAHSMVIAQFVFYSTIPFEENVRNLGEFVLEGYQNRHIPPSLPARESG